MAWFVIVVRFTHRVQHAIRCVSLCTLLVGCQYGALATVAYCAHAFLLFAGVLVRHYGTTVEGHTILGHISDHQSPCLFVFRIGNKTVLHCKALSTSSKTLVQIVTVRH